MLTGLVAGGLPVLVHSATAADAARGTAAAAAASGSGPGRGGARAGPPMTLGWFEFRGRVIRCTGVLLRPLVSLIRNGTRYWL